MVKYSVVPMRGFYSVSMIINMGAGEASLRLLEKMNVIYLSFAIQSSYS